ncbi:MAG: HD domain-containing protein [Christensenellaceae bacterium]
MMKKVATLTEIQLKDYRQEFITLLKKTKRKNMESLILWLENETDFFVAPASTKMHGSFVGGLLLHSLNVYKLLVNFNKKIGMESQDSLIIAGLLHDVCKANLYVKRIKNVKIQEQNKWVEEESFAIEDGFPFGHGEKSVYLLMKHIVLTDEEAMAIRWHMGGYDDAARSYIGGITQSNAYAAYPLAPALSIADMYATYFADK